MSKNVYNILKNLSLQSWKNMIDELKKKQNWKRYIYIYIYHILIEKGADWMIQLDQR